MQTHEQTESERAELWTRCRDLSASLDTQKAVSAELRAKVQSLELAEEGAKEAFGVVVQAKRDLEAEVKRLRGLLAAAYKMVPQHHAV